MSLQTATKKWERDKEKMRRQWPWPTYKQHGPISIIRRRRQLHVAFRHSNPVICYSKWKISNRSLFQPRSAACLQVTLMIYLLFLLPVCFIGSSINQSINRLVYHQTAWTEFKSRLAKYRYAIVQLIPTCSLLTGLSIGLCYHIQRQHWANI